MADCKTFRVEIEGAADDGALGREAAAHASACAACGEALREREALRALVRGLARVEAPADFEFRLRARMAASKPRGGLALFGRLRTPGLAWAAAALCLVSISASLYLRQSQEAEPAAPSESRLAGNIPMPPRPTVQGPTRAGAQAPPQSDVAGRELVSESRVEPERVRRVSAPGDAHVKREAAQASWSDFVSREHRAETPAPGSFDSAIRSAPVIKHLPDGEVASRPSAQGIQLGTSSGTLSFVLRDERGARVPMRSVSFGAQEALLRDAAGRPAAKDEEGVW